MVITDLQLFGLISKLNLLFFSKSTYISYAFKKPEAIRALRNSHSLVIKGQKFVNGHYLLNVKFELSTCSTEPTCGKYLLKRSEQFLKLRPESFEVSSSRFLFIVLDIHYSR